MADERVLVESTSDKNFSVMGLDGSLTAEEVAEVIQFAKHLDRLTPGRLLGKEMLGRHTYHESALMMRAAQGLPTEDEERDFIIEHYASHISTFATLLDQLSVTKDGLFVNLALSRGWDENYTGDQMLNDIIETATKLREAIAYRRMFGSSSLKS